MAPREIALDANYDELYDDTADRYDMPQQERVMWFEQMASLPMSSPETAQMLARARQKVG